MSLYLLVFLLAFVVSLLILVAVDAFCRDEVEWLKCRLCKWWAREAEDK